MSEERDPERDQQLPVHNNFPSCHNLLVEDVLERKEFGKRKYQTELQPFNGRSFMQDLYEELIDGAAYIRGLLEEDRRRQGRFGEIGPELFDAHRIDFCNLNEHYKGDCCRVCGHDVIHETQSEHYARIVNEVDPMAKVPAGYNFGEPTSITVAVGNGDIWEKVRKLGNVDDPEVIDTNQLSFFDDFDPHANNSVCFVPTTDIHKQKCVNHPDRQADYTIMSAMGQAFYACLDCFDVWHER